MSSTKRKYGRFRLDSLFNRIMLSMLLLFAVMSSIVFWYWEFSVEPRLQNAEQAKADMLTTAGTPSIIQLLEQGDPEQIRLHANRLLLLKDPNTGHHIINGITIEKADGSIIVDIRPEKASQHFISSTLLFAESADRGMLGNLTLYYSQEFYKKIHRTGEKTLLAGLILVLTIFFISLVLLNYLLRPLWHMTQELRDFSIDRAKILPQLAGPRIMEIERVREAINELLEIQKNHRQHLQKTVAQRTSELRQANTALSESEEKYRTLVERSNDGITIIQQGVIKYINPKVEEILGFNHDQLLDHQFADFVKPGRKQEWIRQRFTESIDEQTPLIHETVLLRQDREEVYVELNDGPVQFLNQAARLIFIRDITERKRMENDLIKSRNLQSLGVLAGGIAHDFNNLLTSVFGFIDLARNNVRPEDKIHTMLSKALKASELAQHLTRQLLTFSKGGSPRKQIISIVDLLKESGKFTMSGSNIKYDITAPEKIKSIEGDKGQLEQVIQNLLINAKEAMPEGGTIQISVENHVVEADTASLAKGEYVKIRATDNGPGIAKEVLPSIFDPYFSTKKMGQKKGTGLGLAICHSIIHQHGGDISATSELGKGTTFEIILPVTDTNIPSKDPQYDIPEKLEADGNGHILVMDDDETLQSVAGEMLKLLGYEVSFSSNGQEAVDLYLQAREKGTPFTAVILDLTIPGGMGGEKTVQELRRIDPQVCALVSSGYNDNQILENYEKYGFNGVIQKPFNLQTLQKALARVIGLEAK